jgi:sterol 3beta-glucosyltransferase
MKVVFLTLGTRGDVQPYVALGKALIKSGQEAVVCTGKSFQGFVEQHRVSFYPAEIDFMEILKTPEGKAMFHGGGNLLKMKRFLKEVIMPGYQRTMYDFLEASKDADLIIYHPKALAATDIAEFRKIPCICMPPVPIIVPISEFPSMAISASKNFGPTWNRLTYKISAFGLASFMKMINQFRREELKLPKRKVTENYLDINGKSIPVVYPISASLFQDVTSWKDKVYLPGFFYLDNEEETLDEKIQNFLSKGSKPIVISFSSMPLKDPNGFLEMIKKMVDKTGERVILITGSSGIEVMESDNILMVQQISHRLIFPVAKGIIHHGGIGTVAEALRSGRPQLIIPFSVDQPFWAQRLYKQGYALKPIRENELTLDLFMEVIKDMKAGKTLDKMQSIQSELNQENGTKNMVLFIENLMKGQN